MKFYRSTYILENDELVYGLVVKARAGVVCLIQPLTETDTAGNLYMTYCPDEDDSSIFAYSTLKPTPVAGPLKMEESREEWLEFLLYQKKDVPL